MRNGDLLDLLIIIDDKEIICLHGRCSYGNCLLEEELLDNKLYCKYHGCFYDSNTGDILEGPSLYSLKKY